MHRAAENPPPWREVVVDRTLHGIEHLWHPLPLVDERWRRHRREHDIGIGANRRRRTSARLCAMTDETTTLLHGAIPLAMTLGMVGIESSPER
jgi:hypothetical protein